MQRVHIRQYTIGKRWVAKLIDPYGRRMRTERYDMKVVAYAKKNTQEDGKFQYRKPTNNRGNFEI
ncbi:hypothetical protein FRC02_008351 [Tulasnella sp. 418]|nr:hypothetical protein FRC02_008351 [Tulasnella sp. 418]